jgi:hypothetical protein
MVPIPTDHVAVNAGFSVPRVTEWFGDDTTLLSADVVSNNILSGIYPTRFFILCSQFDKRFKPKCRDTCKLLIFRKSVTGNYLVNFRNGDELYMPDVVKW